MGLSRGQFCTLAGFKEERFKSADRREQLVFLDTSHGQGWSAMDSLLLALFGRFTSLPDGQGIDNMRAATIVAEAMPEIDRNWDRIVASGHALDRGVKNVAEIMVGRALIPWNDPDFVARVYARMKSGSTGDASRADALAPAKRDQLPVCGTMAEIAQVNGGVFVDLNVTSISRCFAVLIRKADYLKLDLPALFYPPKVDR